MSDANWKIIDKNDDRITIENLDYGMKIFVHNDNNIFNDFFKLKDKILSTIERAEQKRKSDIAGMLADQIVNSTNN